MTTLSFKGCRALLVLLLSVAVLLQAASCERRPSFILGTDAIDAVMVEGESPLPGWIERGYRGMTVIHVDAHDSLGAVPEDLKNIRERAEGPQIDGQNYLSAAVRLGIIKEIYWVIPYPFFETPGGGLQARRFLFDTGAAGDWSEASGLVLNAGCLKGPLRGVQVTICAPDTIPPLAGPVLLDIDSDFIPVFAGSREINAVGGLSIAMKALFARGYEVVEVDIRPGSGGDPVEIYSASELKEVLADPMVLKMEAPPPLWAARDGGETLLAGRKFSEAYDSLKSSQEEFGSDKGLRALLAEAALRTGRHEEAFALADELCKEDKTYCALLAYLGAIGEEAESGLMAEPNSSKRP